MSDFSHTLYKLRKSLKLTQSQMAEKMGLSLSYIHQLEAEKRTPSDAIRTLVQIMQTKEDLGGSAYNESGNEQGGLGDILEEEISKYRCRMIPLVGWAHAGDPLDYEGDHESPLVPTECRDPQAFGVRLEGDSMEPRFYEDDVLIVMPSEFAHSGSFAVAKFKEGGIIFRQIERQIGAMETKATGDEFVRLVPVNARWTVTEHKEQDFEWIYPVWGRWTQIWNK
ncbi:LexA family protein [Rubritalea sp.]|uniref:LexA family protein n=1 Tax=Rubritalea sp. TaxID=2109375 RepID=UPI003EF4EDDF